MNVQWYPGHMAKTRRMIAENLKLVDVVAEIVDARIPISSRNPDIDELVGSKPRIIDSEPGGSGGSGRQQGVERLFQGKGLGRAGDGRQLRQGCQPVSPAVRALLRDQIAAWASKGQVGRKVRAMVVGVPNVGKSTFINKVAKRKSAIAQNRPGVTRGKQWVAVDSGMELSGYPRYPLAQI